MPPLSESDERMERSFEDRYGKKGKSIYYATLNSRINEGRPINSPESKHVASKRKHRKSKTRRKRKMTRSRRR